MVQSPPRVYLLKLEGMPKNWEMGLPSKSWSRSRHWRNIISDITSDMCVSLESYLLYTRWKYQTGCKVFLVYKDQNKKALHGIGNRYDLHNLGQGHDIDGNADYFRVSCDILTIANWIKVPNWHNVFDGHTASGSPS